MQIAARAALDAVPPTPARSLPPRFRRRMPGDVLGPRELGGRLRASRRLAGALVWILFCIPVQAVLMLLPGITGLGRGKVIFARIFWAVLCRLIGLRVRVVGQACTQAPVLYVSNHSSWLDILVLGGVLEAPFVAKAEVSTWPVIRTIARLGRTVFVSRSRGSTGKEAAEMRDRMHAGDNMILFPEGTSNDGTRELPFRSSFFAIADAAGMVQPVSVVYDRLGGLPACRRDRPIFAWYGDMELASHFWRLARRTGARVTVLLHEPFPPSDLPDRKVMATQLWQTVSAGAAALRQNRPVQPAPAPTPQPQRRQRQNP